MAFASVDFHKGSSLTFNGGQSKTLTCKTVAMTLAPGKNKVKYIMGLWLLHTQALLEGGVSFSLLPISKDL